MHPLPFIDRSRAACALGPGLRHYYGRDDVTVLGLPRGGVPMAAAIASRLGAPFFPLTVEKVRLENGAVHGAIADDDVVAQLPSPWPRLAASRSAIQLAMTHARDLLRKKQMNYGLTRSSGSLADRCAILVDDGIDSGLTMLTAIRAARRRGAASVVVAAPVASTRAAELLGRECDVLICLALPKPFHSVAECYVDFAPVPDEVCADIIGSRT